MLNMGVTVVAYQSDNGVFTAAAFLKEILERQQAIAFSGVGAHHQNVVAERGIGTIMSMARTIMLHSTIWWPDVADSSLWPMAVDYAVYIYNHIPNVVSGLLPIELATHTAQQSTDFITLHVWGSPAYVLDPKLQDGHKLPEWKPRSRRANFLGLSKRHAATIPLVLNCQTLAILAQFHVIFDDWFTTVVSTTANDSVPEWWSTLFTTKFRYQFDDGDPATLDDSWLDAQEVAHHRFLESKQRVVPPGGRPAGVNQTHQHSTAPSLEKEKATRPIQTPTPAVSEPPPTPPPVVVDDAQEVAHRRFLESKQGVVPPGGRPAGVDQTHQHSTAPSPEKEKATRPIQTPTSAVSEPPPTPPPVVVDVPSPTPSPMMGLPSPSPRRSRRASQPPSRLIESGYLAEKESFVAKSGTYRETLAYIVKVCSVINKIPTQEEKECAYRSFLDYDPDTGLYLQCTPLTRAYVASKSDPDTLTWPQAMMSDDSEGFWQVMQKEVSSLQQLGTWNVVRRKPGFNVLASTWAFKRKRYPDGRLKPLKAHFSVRGDRVF